MSKNCKNCYHYKPCKGYGQGIVLLSTNVPFTDEEYIARYCNKYKDKDLIVELPFKEGQIIYGIYRGFWSLLISEEIIIGFEIYGNEVYIKTNYQFEYRLDTLGEKFFLTKEGAEAKLKELEDEH